MSLRAKAVHDVKATRMPPVQPSPRPSVTPLPKLEIGGLEDWERGRGEG